MKKGKLIVIDGTDGSGKATQTAFLARALKKRKIKVRTIDFPQYYKNFFGEFLGRCLAGHYKEFLSIHPKIVSVLYAADRFESKKQIENWLVKGFIVIVDRYVSSNQIHQGGKIKNSGKRRDFMRWLEKMEYEIFGIPRPDIIFYLDIPVSISRKLLSSGFSKSKKKYLGGRKDIAEKNVAHLEASRRSALKLVGELNNFVKIQCMKNGNLMLPKEIHKEIYEKVKGILNK